MTGGGRKEGRKGCVGKSFSSLISREGRKGEKEKSTEKERNRKMRDEMR